MHVHWRFWVASRVFRACPRPKNTLGAFPAVPWFSAESDLILALPRCICQPTKARLDTHLMSHSLRGKAWWALVTPVLSAAAVCSVAHAQDRQPVERGDLIASFERSRFSHTIALCLKPQALTNRPRPAGRPGHCLGRTARARASCSGWASTCSRWRADPFGNRCHGAQQGWGSRWRVRATAIGMSATLAAFGHIY